MDVEPILLPWPIYLWSAMVIETIEFTFRINAPCLWLLSGIIRISDSSELHLINTSTIINPMLTEIRDYHSLQRECLLHISSLMNNVSWLSAGTPVHPI